MRFCPNCGVELNEGALFCGNCGYSLQEVSPVPRKSNPRNPKRMHCPECKSNDISPIVETEISSGTSFNHSFSKRNSISTMQFNNTHRNYWMCSNCGCKFRNIQNLEEEIKNTQSIVKRGIIGIILWAVFTLFITIVGGFGFIPALNIVLLLLFIAAVFYLNNRITKLKEEKVYLKKHCFN